MSTQPLITIITNTKNRAGLISRCIESIKNQTYQNYEHIIADGGDDNTEEIVQSYNDPKIKYIRVSIGGPVAQTRAAFDMSKGEYITFLDDDDEYLPEKLEKQLELILSLSDDYGFIYGSMSYYDNDTKAYLYDHKATVSGGVELLEQAISQPIVCGTPTFMFRRKAFASIGGTWVAGIGNEMSDWAMGCAALKKGWKVAALVDSYLKIYVNHQSVRMSDKGFYDDYAIRYKKFHIYFLEEYADIIRENPQSGKHHYEGLIFNTIVLHEYYSAFRWWKKLLRSSFSFKSLMLLPYYLVRYVFLKK